MKKQIKFPKRLILPIIALVFVLANIVSNEIDHQNGWHLVDILDHYASVDRIHIEDLRTGQTTECSSGDTFQRCLDELKPGSGFANWRQVKALRAHVSERLYKITFYIGDERFFDELICKLEGDLNQEDKRGLVFTAHGATLTAEIDGKIYVALRDYRDVLLPAGGSWG